MKILSLIIILGLVTIVSGFFFWKSDNRCLILNRNGYWMLEIARTPEQQARGLMYRKNLCSRCGMLFVFDTEKPLSFWMKNTFIPLDIYFYDKNGHLIDKTLNMRPMSETGEPMTYTSRPAQYVLETLSRKENAPIDIKKCLLQK